MQEDLARAGLRDLVLEEGLDARDLVIDARAVLGERGQAAAGIDEIGPVARGRELVADLLRKGGEDLEEPVFLDGDVVSPGGGLRRSGGGGRTR